MTNKKGESLEFKERFNETEKLIGNTKKKVIERKKSFSVDYINSKLDIKEIQEKLKQTRG